MDNLTELEKRIVKRLAYNIPPSPTQMSASREEINLSLEFLKSVGIVEFDYMQHAVFKNEPININLTSKGKEIAELIKAKVF